MYVYILSYFVNKLEIWWLYLSPIEYGLDGETDVQIINLD